MLGGGSIVLVRGDGLEGMERPLSVLVAVLPAVAVEAVVEEDARWVEMVWRAHGEQ